MIAHASVDLCTGEAAALITALRSRCRFSPNEFKSGQFLRNPAAGQALEWLLAALRGRAYVHLADKEDQRPAALTRYRARHLAGSDWRVFLAAFVDLVRTKRRHRPDSLALERFFQARDALLRDRLGAQAKDVLDGLSRTRVQAVLTRLFAGDRSIPPPLSRCCRRWPRPCCSGAAAESGRCW